MEHGAPGHIYVWSCAYVHVCWDFAFSVCRMKTFLHKYLAALLHITKPLKHGTCIQPQGGTVQH